MAAQDQRSFAARAVLSALLVLAGGGLLIKRMLAMAAAERAENSIIEPPPSQPRSVDASVPMRPQGALLGLRVGNVTGTVERRNSTETTWRSVQNGETIGSNEALRTGPGAAAVLELQDGTTVWLWPESQVTAERLDVALSRIGLAVGRADLNVPRRGDRVVEVASGGGAVASARDARFAIIVDGAQVMTVANRDGEVEVVSGEGRVRVPPGMQTRARPGRAPEPVERVPPELLLAVDWPATTLRTATSLVRGRAPSGVLVSVGGVRVVVNDNGTFEHQVQLNEGENRVEVVAEDVVGRRVVRRSPNLHVDTTPPRVRVQGVWQ